MNHNLSVPQTKDKIFSNTTRLGLTYEFAYDVVVFVCGLVLGTLCKKAAAS